MIEGEDHSMRSFKEAGAGALSPYLDQAVTRDRDSGSPSFFHEVPQDQDGIAAF